jgi:hypothetical protein
MMVFEARLPGHDVPVDVSEARVRPQHRYKAGQISTREPAAARKFLRRWRRNGTECFRRPAYP